MRSPKATSAPLTVSLVSLGCPKNLVDSEVLVGRLVDGDFELSAQPEGSDVVVVNTCGFIGPARDESRRTIEEMVELKRRGAVRGVVVAGCLVRRLGRPLADEFPEVDAFLDLSDYADAPRVLDRFRAAASPARADALAPFFGGGGAKRAETDLVRARLTLPHVAYLRVSEGCDRACAFCAIPAIRGPQRSKPLEILVAEAEALAASGAREICLVGEETTAWGSDLGRPYGEGLAEVLAALSRVEGIDWVRVLYAHPGSLRESTIEAMARYPNVARYLDMPIQHADAEILKRMKRGTPPDRIRRLIDRLRERVEGIALRTTILVGFPGETERAFAELLRFLEEVRFDRLGCFVYSREEGTSSYDLPDDVPEDEKERRREEVMRLQHSIAHERSRSVVGTEVDVLVDAVGEEAAVGRTEADAPEIDGTVRVEGEGCEPGAFVKVRIERAEGYDLFGGTA